MLILHLEISCAHSVVRPGKAPDEPDVVFLGLLGDALSGLVLTLCLWAQLTDMLCLVLGAINSVLSPLLTALVRGLRYLMGISARAMWRVFHITPNIQPAVLGARYQVPLMAVSQIRYHFNTLLWYHLVQAHRNDRSDPLKKHEIELKMVISCGE